MNLKYLEKTKSVLAVFDNLTDFSGGVVLADNPNKVATEYVVWKFNAYGDLHLGRYYGDDFEAALAGFSERVENELPLVSDKVYVTDKEKEMNDG